MKRTIGNAWRWVLAAACLAGLTGCATLGLFDAEKAIQGTWTSEKSSVVYAISKVDGAMVVEGRSGISGKELMIGDVSWDGSVLRFSSYMPSTDIKVVHENRMKDARTMVSTTGGGDGHTLTWIKQK